MWNFTKKARFYSSKKLIFCSIFLSIFCAKCFKKKMFFIKTFWDFVAPQIKICNYNKLTNESFFLFFLKFFVKNNKNVNLKYQNLKEDEHFYFIQSQQNFASFFLKLLTQNFWNRAPFVFLSYVAIFCLSKFMQIVKNWFKIEKNWNFFA